MRLADAGKRVLEKDKNPDRNVVGWAVLEFFDHAGTDLQTYFGGNYSGRHGKPIYSAC
jgi:hypothetical protein